MRGKSFTVSDYLLARLQQVGLEHMFAVPGDYCSPFLDALEATPEIQRIGNVNELGSGHAADGYARYKGVAAVCVQYGAGVFSLLNCTAGSYVERVPVVVISASPNRRDRDLERTKGILFHHSTGKLRVDQAVLQNVTVAAEIVRTADDAPAQIDRAITAMLTHRRPVYIEVFNNVWGLPCASPSGTLVAQRTRSDPASLSAALEAAWSRIQGARLPVLWAGVEMQRYGLQGTLQQIVDRSGLCFTTTLLGKTVLDESQPQFIGTYAGPASPALTRAVMEATDCPIALGTVITDDYLEIMGSRFGDMIEVTSSETRVGQQYFRKVTLEDFAIGLLARFQSAEGYPRKAALPAVPEEAESEAAPDEPLSHERFCRELLGFLKGEKLAGEVALILGESTSLYVFSNLFGLPRNGFVAQAAWGSPGHETGCALGVALGSGKRPFVVAGDGGFRMLCQELSSLAQQKCNAVIFVLSNHAYALEQAFVDAGAFKPEGQLAAFNVLPPWDYAALARAFGAAGYRVEKVKDLRGVLAEVKSLTGVPSLVEVVLPQKDLPPQLARLAAVPAATRKYGRGRR